MPTPGGGLQVHTQGRCIPACTEAAPPPTAIAAGGTHPTGMHSCLACKQTKIKNAIQYNIGWNFGLKDSLRVNKVSRHHTL